MAPAPERDARTVWQTRLLFAVGVTVWAVTRSSMIVQEWRQRALHPPRSR